VLVQVPELVLVWVQVLVLAQVPELVLELALVSARIRR
jgi:hypothetical protein